MKPSTLYMANLIEARIKQINNLTNADKVIMIIRYEYDSDEPVSHRFEPNDLDRDLLKELIISLAKNERMRLNIEFNKL